MLDAVAERYPARHYVMVGDKLRILAAMKQAWHGRPLRDRQQPVAAAYFFLAPAFSFAPRRSRIISWMYGFSLRLAYEPGK